MYRSRLSRSGISLPEILLATAIICLLAAILFPVFVRARDDGKRARCASNMRQLGNAFRLYLSDWNGVYPAPGGLKGDFNYWSQTGSGGIVSYLGRNGGIGTVWCCPELTDWNGLYPARSYSMNSYLRNPPDVDYPGCVGLLGGCPESLIEVSKRTVLLFEGMPVLRTAPDTSYYLYVRRCGNWTCVRGWYALKPPQQHVKDWWRPWHGDSGNNYLYCDGHVVAKRPDSYLKHPPYDLSNEWWVQKSVMAARYGKY
jgi:prepilin-type processing-associated H-X9-DG protein